MSTGAGAITGSPTRPAIVGTDNAAELTPNT
jgi:hypothetical protein